MKTMKQLLETLPQVGRLEWIGLSPESHGEIASVESAEVERKTGLNGDHHARSGNGRSKRQVTLIQQEHLAAVAGLLNRDEVPAGLVRRNLVVSGINLLALKKQRFRIGEVILEGTGPCEPCSRMETNLGPGGYNAMRGHGGITTRVIQGGTIQLGDEVAFLPPEPDESSQRD